MQEVSALILGPVRLDTVSPTAHQCCDVSSELFCLGAKPRRWAPPLILRFGVIPCVIVYNEDLILFFWFNFTPIFSDGSSRTDSLRTAESIAIGLLQSFSDQTHVTSNDFNWLISEEDVPQKVINLTQEFKILLSGPHQLNVISNLRVFTFDWNEINFAVLASSRKSHAPKFNF